MGQTVEGINKKIRQRKEMEREKDKFYGVRRKRMKERKSERKREREKE